jgi:poly(A) polymerase
LDFQVEAGTLQGVERDAPLLSGVAGERVRDELLKTLEAPGTTRHLRLLDQVGLLCQAFPELEQGRGVQQPKEHYWDVLQHNIEAVGMAERLLDRQGAAQDPTLSVTPWPASLEGHFAEEVCDGFSRGVFLKVSGLLHDLGKPATRSVEPSGRIRFLGHQQVGATQAGEALRRLRVGGRGVRLVEASVLYHLRPGQLGKEGEPPTRRAVYHYLRDVGEAALDTLYLNLADYLAARGPRGVEPGDWRHRCQSVAAVLSLFEEEAKAPPPKLVDGHLLMEALGLEPGPLVGRLLDVVQEAQAAGEIATQEEALALSREVLAKLKREEGASPDAAGPEEEGQEGQG